MRSYSFASIVRDAQRARWSLDEISAGIHDVDFGQAFLPEGLVHTAQVSALDGEQARVLNHIRAHAYLRLFALVERFILPYAMLHAGRAMSASADQLLALMQFGEEEAKHIALFERFSEAFELGFGTHCEVVGPPDAVADVVLAEDPVAVGLLVLHIEWMTQEHYTQSVRDSGGLDPAYASLLKHHWMEEAQHARIDMLLLEQSLTSYADHRRDAALAAYLGLLERLDALLAIQVDLDLEALERTVGRLDASLRDALRVSQRGSYREVFLRAGLEHRRVRSFLKQHFGREGQRVVEAGSRWALA